MSGPIPVPRCQAHKPFFFFGIHPLKNKLERFPLLATLIFLLTKAYKKEVYAKNVLWDVSLVYPHVHKYYNWLRRLVVANALAYFIVSASEKEKKCLWQLTRRRKRRRCRIMVRIFFRNLILRNFFAKSWAIWIKLFFFVTYERAK